MLTAANPTANPNELLNDQDAARVIGVTAQTLSVWRCTGRYDLPFLKIGRLVRYRRADLEAWLESRVVRAGTE